MLIEFTVSNFRSFREKQTLSMVAAPRLHKRENVFKPESKGEDLPSLLKVAVIYGPNASGKSNLLKALGVLTSICFREPSNRDVPLPLSSFRFDGELHASPSVFEIHFVRSGLRYQFRFSATSDRIFEERLTVFPKGKESLLYERLFSAESEIYKFGELLKEHSTPNLLDVWQKLTPPKLLFIAQAVANSSDEFSPLHEPFKWLKESTLSLLDGMDGMARIAQDLAQKSDLTATRIAEFLRDVDVPISTMRVETVKPKQSTLRMGLMGVGLINSTGPDAAPNSLLGRARSTVLTHTSALGNADMDFDDESEGTKNLIGFWLPWVTKDPVDKSRCLLIVDELDSSLHPKIVAALVEKHIKSERPSQLIFSTHDTHLMDAKLLRRDQFWITERDVNGATQLRSIHDFEGRESEDIEKRYYEGRYRGLPFVKRG